MISVCWTTYTLNDKRQRLRLVENVTLDNTLRIIIIVLFAAMYLDVFHGFPRTVTYDDRGRNFFTVIVYFPVQRDFQADFAVRKREPFANQRTR